MIYYKGDKDNVLTRISSSQALEKRKRNTEKVIQILRIFIRIIGAIIAISIILYRAEDFVEFD